MTDLELLQKWCETCLDFIHPAIWREIQNRNLTNIVNHLPKEGAFLECQNRYQKYLNSRTEKIKALEKQQNEERLRLDGKNIEANIFYTQYNIPFKFDIGEKEVLSGLSENSWGDGQKKNTVQHILVLEDFQKGKLTRQYGDFLCTSKSKNNGQNWSGGATFIRYKNGLGEDYMPMPTCKQCLKYLKKWEK